MSEQSCSRCNAFLIPSHHIRSPQKGTSPFRQRAIAEEEEEEEQGEFHDDSSYDDSVYNNNEGAVVSPLRANWSSMRHQVATAGAVVYCPSMLVQPCRFFEGSNCILETGPSQRSLFLVVTRGPFFWRYCSIMFDFQMVSYNNAGESIKFSK
jgi:hypothetical protein